ncbi:unnamed protein product, partial [Mesorhabditis belari]|uniref:rRNA-processing protein UTP23 homolog n=1 Tax=Mesorhabditis belari TaxID=2138241 RepID=A0AAF3FRV3_9BILA
MKVKRVKRAAKILNFFKYNYKLFPPLRILVDGTFCLAALKDKINLREQMSKYVGADCQILTTKCVLKELELIGEAVYGAQVICKQFALAGCPHTPCRSAAECLAHLARKMNRRGEKFIFGTQDDALREKLRGYPGVPHMFIKFNTILLDDVSEASKSAVLPENAEINEVRELKTSLFDKNKIMKKPKGPKGINPLSCKKKKTTKLTAQRNQQSVNGEKKKRRRKKASAKEVPS